MRGLWGDACEHKNFKKYVLIKMNKTIKSYWGSNSWEEKAPWSLWLAYFVFSVKGIIIEQN